MGLANEEKIKRMIIEGANRGVCDKDGESIIVDGRLVAPPKKFRPTHIYRNKKWQKY